MSGSGFKGSGITDPFLTPNAPTIDSVTADGFGNATVNFSAPVPNTINISSYVVSAKTSDNSSVSTTVYDESPATIDLSANLGTTEFAVQAFNTFGAGQFSGYGNSTSVTGTELYAWGLNVNGETTGTSDTTNKSTPTAVSSAITFKQVNIGDSISGYVTSNNELYLWGSNDYGQIGQGNTSTSRTSPLQVGSDKEWAGVFIGPSTKRYVHQVTTSGELWGQGRNSNGCLGDGAQIERSSPVQIGALTNWYKGTHCNNINSTANFTTFFIKTDGTLWGWGADSNGVLGQNTDGLSSVSPLQIGSATNWTHIVAFNHHAHGLRGTSLYGWGQGSSGVIGDGQLISQSSPVQIAGSWSDVSAGDEFAMGIKADGTLWGWGLGSVGQNGSETRTTSSSPVQVGALTNWSRVFCGGAFTIASKTDGTLWGWGDNSNSRLGLNDTVDRSSPVQIGVLTGWTAGEKDSSVGDHHSMWKNEVDS